MAKNIFNSDGFGVLLNRFSNDNDLNGKMLEDINSMYRIEMHVDFYQSRTNSIDENGNLRTGNNSKRRNSSYQASTLFFYDNAENSYTKDAINKLTSIIFYTDQENLPNFNFDANIEEGFKSVLLSTVENTLNSNGVAKLTKLSPNSYYTPLADKHSKKMYTSGNLNNINFKFRLYDSHYLQINHIESTQPLDALAYLTSCIFPFGDNGEGGTVEEIVNAMFSGLKGFFETGENKDDNSIITDAVKSVIESVFGDEGTNNKEKFKKLLEQLRKRPQGCPTIIIDRIGDRIFKNDYDKWEFFLTNINATFSKDLIQYGKSFYPIYIDFEITLSPSYIPSYEKMQQWLFFDLPKLVDDGNGGKTFAETVDDGYRENQIELENNMFRKLIK